MSTQYDVNVFRDAKTGVWVATSDDIPGLVTEAETYEVLIERIRAAAPELLQLNAHQLREPSVGPVSLNIAQQIQLAA